MRGTNNKKYSYPNKTKLVKEIKVLVIKNICLIFDVHFSILGITEHLINK